jgi:hypothetical protein
MARPSRTQQNADGQTGYNSFLGAAVELAPDDLREIEIAASKITIHEARYT